MRRLRTIALLPLLGALAVPATAASFHTGQSIVFDAAEVHHGDHYAAGGSVTLSGEMQGDLAGFGNFVNVTGELHGDLFAWASAVSIVGTVHDAARVGSSHLIVSGTIDGDLLAFAEMLTIEEGAVIGGDLHAFAARVEHRGTVLGGMYGTGGELTLAGRVGRDVDVTFDKIEVDERMRIEGNLEYEARRELERVPPGCVGGEVSYRVKEDEKPSSAWSVFRWWLRLWLFLATLLIGGVLIRFLPKPFELSSATLSADGWLAALVGVGTCAVTAGVALFSSPLIFPSLILLALLLIVLFLGKIPLALWLGQRLIGLAGLRSPLLALLAGAIVVHGVLILIPWFWLWFLVWLAIAMFGIGSVALGLTRHYRGSPAT